jgi:hypothetical protein
LALQLSQVGTLEGYEQVAQLALMVEQAMQTLEARYAPVAQLEGTTEVPLHCAQVRLSTEQATHTRFNRMNPVSQVVQIVAELQTVQLFEQLAHEPEDTK